MQAGTYQPLFVEPALIYPNSTEGDTTVKKFFVLLLALAYVIGTASMALAQEEEVENPVIASTEDGVTLPAEELVAGIITLSFQNIGRS